MIINKQEYQIRKAQAKNFEKALKEFHEYPTKNSEIDPRLLKAEEDVLQTLLTRLKVEINEYEAKVKPESEVHSDENNPESEVDDGAELCELLETDDVVQTIPFETPANPQEVKSRNNAGSD